MITVKPALHLVPPLVVFEKPLVQSHGRTENGDERDRLQSKENHSSRTLRVRG
ncbi:hypothetical protein J6590_063178 [Homalodisca vitripennis]|nr:hypothetical protein J6590_063178 [Homalodisca vitripennis]